MRNTLAFHSDYDFRTFFKLLHYCSINLNCCRDTCQYFIFAIKDNCQTDNCGKFGKKLLLLTSQIIPGDGDFASFFSTQGLGFCTKKLSSGRGILRKKIGGPRVSPGGMATSQIDTCINKLSCLPNKKIKNFLYV